MKKDIPSSAGLLIIANCLPLGGVLFWNWNLVDILAVYWTETVIIGFYSLLKVMLARDEERGWKIIFIKFSRVFGCLFFVLHFGGFVAGLGVIFYFVSREFLQLKLQPWELLYTLRYALIFMFFSHGYSFIVNYLLKGERDISKGNDPIFEPYRRVLVMVFTLSFGMGFVIHLGEPLYMLIILIILKTAADLWSHLKERKRFQAAEPH